MMDDNNKKNTQIFCSYEEHICHGFNLHSNQAVASLNKALYDVVDDHFNWWFWVGSKLTWNKTKRKPENF